MKPTATNVSLKPSKFKFWSIWLLYFVLLILEIGDSSDRWWRRGLLILISSLGLFLYVRCVIASRTGLLLSSAGFQYGPLHRQRFYRWTDIEKFLVLNMGFGEKVCVTLRAGIPGEERVRRIKRRYLTFDKFLPDTYGMTAPDLLRTLEEWRGRYAENAPPTFLPQSSAPISGFSP